MCLLVSLVPFLSVAFLFSSPKPLWDPEPPSAHRGHYGWYGRRYFWDTNLAGTYRSGTSCIKVSDISVLRVCSVKPLFLKIQLNHGSTLNYVAMNIKCSLKEREINIYMFINVQNNLLTKLRDSLNSFVKEI